MHWNCTLLTPILCIALGLQSLTAQELVENHSQDTRNTQSSGRGEMRTEPRSAAQPNSGIPKDNSPHCSEWMIQTWHYWGPEPSPSVGQKPAGASSDTILRESISSDGSRPFYNQMTLSSSDLETFKGPAAIDFSDWNQVYRVTQLLQTDDGAITLLSENLQIAERYSTESNFIDFVRPWRKRIPELSQEFKNQVPEGTTWNVLRKGKDQTIAITFHHANPENAITILTLRWRNHQLASLNFMRGFEHIHSDLTLYKQSNFPN